jgi:hypothetical protein
MGHNVRSYDPATGNDVDIIGGKLVIKDGGEIDIQSGGTAGDILTGVTEVTFTETAGAGVWTGSVTVPAGATLVDIIVNAVALWDSETSATMKVGDVADDDGFFTGIDLKATDLLAGESVSFSFNGGKQGAYLNTTGHVKNRYSATERTISGTITKVGSTGTAGRTRMIVLYAKPTVVKAAEKV